MKETVLISDLREISSELMQISEQIKEDIFHDEYTLEKKSIIAGCSRLHCHASRLLDIADVIQEAADEKKENEDE